MNLKKSIAVFLVAMLLVAVFAVSASADTKVTVGGGSYKVVSPKTVTISGEGVTPSFRGNGTIDVLNDGDIARTVTNHDNKGIVLIMNDEVVARKTTPVVQDLDNIPTAYIEMDFGSAVSFDTAYMGIYWQQAGIGEPADNKVIIETSADGKVWVPVGEDGSYYFSMPKCPDWVEGLPNSDQGYPYVAEVAVPLGETVKAQYVRYSYTFPVMPEGWHWTYYTNVYEFIGFTEVGVATFEGGRKPAKLSAEDVAERPAVEGTWIVEDGDEVSVVTFKDEKGELAYTANVYDKSAYLESGEEAETLDTVEGNYFIEGNTVALITDGGYDDYTVSSDEDGNLILDLDGEEYTYYTAENYAAANGAEPPADTSGDASTDPETSGDESGDESADAETSSAAGETSDKADSSSAASKTETSSTAASKTDSSKTDASEGDDGAPVGLIVGIIAAVAVIIAAVVVIIVVRKKKQ